MIRVQKEDFDLGAEYNLLVEGNRTAGAVASFVGRVRDFNVAQEAGAQEISAMTLEHYPGMTEKELARIEQEANERWPLEASLIIHRYGRLEPGDQIVLVLTASAHRHAALEAAQFLMDWLKTRAPFWKREETRDGHIWVTSRQEDNQAAKRWANKKS